MKGIKRIRNQFDVMRVRCCDDQRQRKPVGVRQKATFYALCPSVRGVAACFFVPDSGDLVIQPSIDNQDQSMPSRCSQASKPFCQKRSKTPASRHSWKRRCAELDTYSCGIQGIPLATGSEHKEHGVHCGTIINPLAMRTQWMVFFVFREQWCNFSQSSSLICHVLLAILQPSEIIIIY